jgi:uncharacterized FlaG/YvyC family protein
MSDYRISTSMENGNYSPTTSSGGVVVSRPQAQETTYPMPSVSQVEKNSQALAVQQVKAVEAEKSSAKEADKAALPITNLSDVFLKFKVDEKTRNITVYVIDRETKRVLRSIPPEEMNKMQSGDLLEFLA